MTIIFAGTEYRVLETAYRDGLPEWYKILLPSGLAWIRAEETI